MAVPMGMKIGQAGCCCGGRGGGEFLSVHVHGCCGLPPNIIATLTASDGTVSTRTVPCSWQALDTSLSYTVTSTDPGLRFTGPVDISFGPGGGGYQTGIQVADGFICCGFCLAPDGTTTPRLPISKTVRYTDGNGSGVLTWKQSYLSAPYRHSSLACGIWSQYPGGDPTPGAYLATEGLLVAQNGQRDPRLNVQGFPMTCNNLDEPFSIGNFSTNLGPCTTTPPPTGLQFYLPNYLHDLNSAATLFSFDAGYICAGDAHHDGAFVSMHVSCVEVLP